MARCKRIGPIRSKMCAGDFRKTATIQARAIQTPVTGSSDYTELFNDEVIIKVAVRTVRGVKIFDSTNTEVDVTHEFTARFRAGLTYQNWIKIDGLKYRILAVTNLNEENRLHVILATLRGPETFGSNFA